MRTHNTKTREACFLQLRRLRQIRCLLGRDVTASLVATFILSRLDYCNALLAALPQSTMSPLQRVMNAAARLVCNLRSRDHVTPALIELHWLPITARVQYKLCLLVHSAAVGTAQDYLKNMLQPEIVRLRGHSDRPRTTTWPCLALGPSSANVRSASPPRERGTVFLSICAPH